MQNNHMNMESAARDAGLNIATVRSRIWKGASLEDALSKPVRKYKRTSVFNKPAKGAKVKKSELVWNYVLKNRLATVAEVARETGVSYPYTRRLMRSVGTPFADKIVINISEVFKRKEETTHHVNVYTPVVEDATKSLRPTPDRRGLWIPTLLGLGFVSLCVMFWG